MSGDRTPNKQLSLLQTLQLSWYAIPSFKMTALIAVAGIAVVFLGWILSAFGLNLQILAFIGAIIAFMGFDEMSKIVAQVSNEATKEDYQEYINNRANNKKG